MSGNVGNQRRGGPPGRGPATSGRPPRPGPKYRTRPGGGQQPGTVWRPDTPPPPSSPEDEERAGVFRETLAVGGWHLDLVARQPVGGSWGAWVRRATGGGSGGGDERFRSITATGPTAADALASLADAIRTAMGQPPQPERQV